jgi:hypothetical protein
MNAKALSSAIAIALVSTSLFATCANAQQAAPAVEFPAPSPTATLKQRVGLTDIEITYSRPGVKGRQIFGGLIPYGEVWRAGANSATKVVFSTPVKLNGQELPAGTYGLFAIPGQSEWTIIINKIATQWGAYSYKQTDDVLRVTARPMKLAELVETYTIDINDIRDQSATLNLIWEKTRVPVKIEVDAASKVVPSIEAAMKSSGTKNAGLYYSSAMFYFENGLDTKKALEWINEAVKLNDKAPYMMLLKARILAKTGDKAGAIAAAKKTAELGVAAEGPKSGFVKMSDDLIASLK